MTTPKQPPLGVETTPSGPVVPLSEAAQWLNKDPRTVIRAICKGTIRGGAIPRPERLRWYVYADQLPSEPPTATTTPPTAVTTPPDAELADLRAEVMSLRETNRLLIAAQQDLLDIDESLREVNEKYREYARKYLDMLGQFMTPGHLGDLSDQF